MRVTLSTLALVFSVTAQANVELATQSMTEEKIQQQLIGDILTREETEDLNLMAKTDGGQCQQVRCLNEVENFVAAAASVLENGSPLHSLRIARRILNYVQRNDLNTADELQLYTVWRQAVENIPLHLGQKIFERKNIEWSENLSRRLTAEFHNHTLTKKSRGILQSKSVPSNEIWGQLKSEIAAVEAQSIRLKSSPRSLVYGQTKIGSYSGGVFATKPKLYMFCRENRVYPCLFVMKNGNGELHKRADGSVWSQSSLALSSRRLDYNQVNGQTPQGVYRIDGVMPIANRQLEFGKFRRLILNFIVESDNETELKKLLPTSHYRDDWWNESIVARDIGRNSLRIHGSGRSSSPGTPYYTFIPTAGCISQRENTYNSVTYIDQRRLLNEIMAVQGLPVKESSESNIKALLYVFELDNKTSAVTVADLTDAGVIK